MRVLGQDIVSGRDTLMIFTQIGRKRGIARGVIRDELGNGVVIRLWFVFWEVHTALAFLF